MKKNISNVLEIVAVLFSITALVLSVNLFITDNTTLSNIEDRISQLESNLENDPNKDINTISNEINELRNQIEDIEEYQDNTDTFKIISSYQEAQENLERRITIFITLLLGASIAFPLLSRAELRSVKKKTKKIKKQLKVAEKIQEKNEQIQDIQELYKTYKSIMDNYSVLEAIIEKTDKLLTSNYLGDTERCRLLLNKARDLQELERNIEAEETYNIACESAEKTDNNYLVAEAYFKKAAFLEKIDKEKALESICKAVEYHPQNFSYLEIKISMYKNQIESTNDNEKKDLYIKEMIESTKKYMQLPRKSKIIDSISSGIKTLYITLNANYAEKYEDSMNWVFNELDVLEIDPKHDLRWHSIYQVNPIYFKTLPQEKQNKYIENGYKITKDKGVTD